MRNRVCLVLPFFTGGGPMPSYANLFFETVARNPELDLLVLSDCGWYEPRSANVTYVACTLVDVRERVQALFDFEVSLDAPYKLCDYRPAYGLIFADYLRGYDFWGNCDLDMAFGDFSRFVTDTMLDSYDKVYQHGHLTLYRNTDVVNREFMSDYGMNYRKVFTTPVSCVFDELEGVQCKFDHDGLRTYKGFDFLDINPWRWHLSRTHSGVPQEMLEPASGFDYEHECFSWNDGHLWRHAIAGGGVIEEEFLYFHFQKRKFVTQKEDIDSGAFWLSNNGCIAKSGPIWSEDVDRYNAFSPLREVEMGIAHEHYIWNRRFNKYVLHK